MMKVGKRTTIAVDNQSHGSLKVKVDCSGSENLMSDQGSLERVVNVNSKSMSVVHHLVADEKDSASTLKYIESIIR